MEQECTNGQVTNHTPAGEAFAHRRPPIYPEVTGVLPSWKAAKDLRLLPECYPHPSTTTTMNSITAASSAPTSDVIMKDYPTVFNNQIKIMEGEKFHILLSEDTKPFCVNTPRSIPFAYWEKLKDELDLLQSQSIIAPVTEPTEWCVPIVVTPKRTLTTYACVSTFPI